MTAEEKPVERVVAQGTPPQEALLPDMKSASPPPANRASAAPEGAETEGAAPPAEHVPAAQIPAPQAAPQAQETPFDDPDFPDDPETAEIPPPPGLIPPSASSVPTDPFALTSMPPGPGLQAEIFPGPAPRDPGPVVDFESEAEIKHSLVTRMINPHLNGISCGDDLFIPERPKKTLEEELADLGFPPRPHLWPHMMAWPPRRDMEILHRSGLTRETLDEYLRAQAVRQDKMLARSKVIEDWLDEYQPDPGFGYRRAEKRTRNEVYRGIQWATLLDEDSAKDAVVSNVMSWGRIRVRTRDGGQARAFPDFVSVDKVTEQAITLAIFEARARGWNTLRIQGSAEFGKQAMLICKKYNIAAEVTMPYLLSKRKKFHVAPSLPGAVAVESDPALPDFDRPGATAEAKALPAPESRKIGIPQEGVKGMPRSPFPAKSTDMGRDIDDPLEEAGDAEPISKRLAFGVELGADRMAPANDRKKANPAKEAEIPDLEG